MEIEQTCRQLDGYDGSPLLYVTIIVEPCQFGGGSLLGLMTLVYSRSKCCLALLLECLIIFALTPLVSVALPFKKYD